MGKHVFVPRDSQVTGKVVLCDREIERLTTANRFAEIFPKLHPWDRERHYQLLLAF
jgi:hypothetical protein